MSYKHGIRIREVDTLPAPQIGTAGLPVFFGTAPVNQTANPVANKIIKVNSYEEAVAAVGYSDDWGNYTLCQAIYACFKVFNIAPIILINVLDPSKAAHKEQYQETLTINNGQAISNAKGILLDGLTVSDGETTLVKGTDYTVKFTDDGYVLYTFITTHTSATASGNKLKPSGVTSTDVIGVSTSGAETGIQLVRRIYPTLNMVPGLLAAPGWSQNAAVGIALKSKCTELNGVFNCECVVDIPADSTCDSYDKVEGVKATLGYNDVHMICVWPQIKIKDKQFFYSALYVAMAAYTDANNDDVPNLSPSNKLLKATEVVLADGTEVAMDTQEANELNAVGVVTALNVNGIKSWGNNTAAYPDVTQTRDRWICCRRFFSWWGNSFILTYIDKVDGASDLRLIESIVDAENIRGNSFASNGKCAGAKIIFNANENPIADVLEGKLKVHQYLAPYTPAEDIENLLEFDASMIETALTGGEE